MMEEHLKTLEAIYTESDNLEGLLWVERFKGNIPDELETSITESTNDGGEATEDTIQWWQWVIEPSIDAEDIQPIVLPNHIYLAEFNYNPHLISDDNILRLSKIQNSGVFGLVDYQGDILLEPEFKDIVIGDDGIYGTLVSDEIIYKINTGEVVSKGLAETSGLGPVWGRYSSHNWLWDVETNSSFFHMGNGGLISKESPTKLVLAYEVAMDMSKFDHYSEENLYEPKFNSEEPFEDRWAMAMSITGNVGYIDDKGIAIPFDFEQGQIFNYNFAAVRIGDKWAYIDKQGNTITEFVYDDVYYDSIGFSEFMKYNSDLGNMPTKFRYIYDFSEGFAAVVRDGGWGFIDVNGNEIVECQFEATRPVYNGMAWVKDNGLWGVINIQSDDV